MVISLNFLELPIRGKILKKNCLNKNLLFYFSMEYFLHQKHGLEMKIIHWLFISSKRAMMFGLVILGEIYIVWDISILTK
jgi:hypothetical protein